MKLHLPSSLRKALLIVLCTAAGVSFTANGASMSTLVTQTTYCDFGDNAGQYAVHGVNALLQHIRDEDEGVFIYYTKDGMQPYNILVNPGQELISFESRTDQGPAAGIGYNFIATVEHNGKLSATFTGTKIGAGNAIHYASIEYNVSSGNVFRLVPRTDYKIARLSKVITDVSTYNLYTEACSTQDDQMRYRSGSGTFYRVDENNTRVQVGGAYTFNTAGIMKVDSASNYPDYPQVKDYRGIADDSGSILNTTQWWKQADIENGRPLPYAVQPGDSGSPTWLYDTETQTYLYAGAMQSANYTTLSQARYAGQWTQDTMEYFDCTVDAVVGQELHITAVNKAEQGRTSTVNGGASVTSHPYSGTVTGDAAGTVSFIGVQEGSHTWKDLAGVKEKANWYAYDNSYLSASTENLFYTNNLVFNAAEAGEYNVVLDATVDTGVGYTRFSRSTVDGYVEFNLSAANNQNYQLDTAGFVVDDGVSLHINLSGESGWVREWRKIGEGDLYLEGSGDNSNILLNLGGSGTTYLQQQGNNCAAYNVLANNGTHVVIHDIAQIEKDFTFGYGGATLDMNGNSMTWNNAAAADDAGFTIHALTDEARIVNGEAGSTSRLTWTQGGTQEYLGSFVETENSGALQFVYAGGDDSKLTLHSIYTNLGRGTGENGESGGIIVQSGTLALQGTLTQHAPGSRGVAYSTAAYSNADDWHYADMTASVKVEGGGTFELGSHARLTGNVSVEEGGTFIVRESVCHQMEYLEGGYTLKNTDSYREYFGHHGSVFLKSSGAKMEIAFGDTADSTLVYGNSISGRGSLLVNPGVQGGEVHLTGDNSGLTGTRSLVHAGLVFDSKEAVGDLTANQWQVSQSGFIVVNEALLSACGGNALNAVTQDSTGALALTQNSSAFDLSNYQGLYIGAYKDCVVQYGTQGTTDELAAQNGQWRLGGGGGELVVNYVLAGANDLVLGDALSRGTVRLTNADNSFSGRILFKGGVTLAYDSDDVLGDASFSIKYTNRVAPGGGLSKIESDSDGVLLLDPLTKVEEGRRVLDQDLNLTSHSKLAIGSSADMEYRGNISVATDADYSFGGSTALMTVQNELAVNGTNGLLVDGQTYAGGEIRLEAASQITGAVTVRGCNPEQLPPGAVPGGSITLSLDTDDALAKTSSFAIENGGILDIRGTSQQFKNLEVKAGGALVSSSGAHTGEVSFSMDRNITWNGSSSVGAIRVTGSGTLTLSAADGAHYDELHMGSGTALSLGANNVLSATGTTYIEQGASLATNGYSSDGNIVIRGNMNAEGSSFSGVVTLENGTVSFRKGNLTSEGTLVSHGGTISGFGGSLNGNCHFLENTTTYSAKNISGAMEQGTSTISGNVEISHGATLKLEYGSIYYPVPVPITINYEYAISSSEFNTATPAEDEDGRIIPNGTLFADTNVLKLTGGNQNFGGTVKIGNHNTIISNSNGTKTFDIFELTGGTTTVNGSAVSWTIAHLNGNGTLNSNINQRLSLTGEGSFSGTLCKSGGSLLLGHESAAAAAEVRLTSSASLVLDADRVCIRALTSSGSDVSITANGRNATLEIAPTDSATYTYAGKVTGDAAHGISLVKAGSGTQEFSNGEIVLHNINVQSGALAFSNAEQAPVVYGDVSIAQGATLNFGEKTLSLAFGQELSIVSGGSGAATFQGNLQFSGGKMLFDSGILSADTAALNHTGTAGLSEGTDALTVNFSNDGLLENQTYLLSSGNWEALSGKIASDSLIYHTATFSATAEGLSVVIGERNDIQIWLGTSTKNNWTSQDFGSEDNRLQAESTAIFNDDAENSNVSITESAQVKEMVFDNKENAYRLVAGTGTTVQADSLRQLGTGSTELLLGNFQIGEAAVEAGSLSLGKGSRVGDISVAEDATLVLKDEEAATGKVSGKGSVLVNWGAGKTGQLDADVANLSVESGTVEAAHTLADTVTVKDGGQYHATAGTHSSAILLGGADEPSDTAALQLGDGVEVDGRVAVAANAAVGVDSEAAGTISGNVEVAAGITLTKTGAGTLTLGADNSATFAGGLVIAAGTVKAGNNHALGVTSTAGRIVVAEGGTLDVNGVEGAVDAYAIIMDGGTLANTGAVVGTGKRQLVTSMVLTADSTVCAESGHEYALIANGYAPTAINLQGKTLEKTGSGTYSLTRTTVTGGEGGTLKVSEGTLNFLTNGGAGSLQADLEMAGGTVSGTVNPGQDISIRTTGQSNITAAIVTGGNGITFTGDANLNDSGVISGEGSVSKQGAGELTLGAANTFTGGTTISKGAVVANNNKALGTGAVSVGAEGTLKLAANLTLSGGMVNSGTIDMGTNKTLTLNGQEGGTTYAVGKLVNADSATLSVGNNATAELNSATSINRVLGQAGSTVEVAKGSTLTLQSTNRSGNTSFYGVDNEGTISIKGSNGDIRLFGSADDQMFNLGHLAVDGNSGTTYVLTSGSVNYTSDIAVKSLSGGGSGHTLQVTTCYNGDGDGKVVDLVLGEQQDDTALYTGKIQYGIGTSSAKNGSGMNVVLKDENVASQAVLEAVFNGDATQSATITVDTALAKVKGLTGSGNASRSMEVSGTEDSENRVIELVGDNTYTYGGKLGAHLDVVHSGSGTQNITGGADDFSGSVAVDSGVLNMLNIAKLVVNDVSIGPHATLGVYSGNTATADAAHEGILTIRNGQSLTAEGPGSTLNANLVMETGSILDVHGMEGTGMTLSGALTLNKGMNLSQADLAAIMGLAAEDTYNLFNGVDSLTLSVTPYDKITPELRIDAAEWFHGIDPHRIYMVYDGENVGVYCMYAVPEPATGTLSLLALAALAARRRRK